ncbi:class I SAM-dependent methyltransferase [Mycoplasma sp. 480]|uniref:class I SAM-dependent methyltransferase n=1 Tax=Mycoplasma sp. 480 TaxID=3440155 RepID=UPI003F512168
MNLNNKKVFQERKTVERYKKDFQEIGLWESEKFLIDKYFPNKELKILDLGCGVGRTTFALYELGYQNIVAIDISQNMIEKAKEINLSKKYNIEFKVEDASRLSFKDNSFDYVLFSFNGWPGIPSEKSRINALKEVFRVLKEKGIFIFSCHDREEVEYLEYYKNFIEECKNEFRFEKYGDFIFKNEDKICDFLHLYSKNELKTILENQNFEILDIISRDEHFKESKKILEISDNTNFWIVKK